MLKAFLISLCAVVSVPLTAEDLPPLEEQTVAEHPSLMALGKIQHYMDTVQSLTAQFQQTSPDGNVAKGLLSMARPGKIRFDYDGDIPFLVVANGKSINFIDYEIGQLTRWPVKDTPLRALLGTSTDLMSINARIDVNPQGMEGLYALTANDPDKPERGEVTLFFENAPDLTGGLKLLSWVVLDAEQKHTSVVLSGQKVNIDLSDDLWTFEDPRGLNKRHKRR